jgi:TPR repeat protein
MMRAIILALALVFGVANAPTPLDRQLQELVDKGDLQQALALARQAAERGESDGHDWMGWFLEEGKGTSPDITRAAQHYRTAAALGENHARWRLGVLMDEGKITGTPQEAVALFKAAAREDYANAIVSLAVMQATGRGTPTDFAAAFANYDRAARLGDSGGMRGVAVMHYLGQGRPVDKAEAAAWLVLSASMGNADAEEVFYSIAGELSPDELDGVEQRTYAIAAEIGIEL